MKFVIILIIMSCCMITTTDLLESYNSSRFLKQVMFFVIPLIFVHFTIGYDELLLNLKTQLNM